MKIKNSLKFIIVSGILPLAPTFANIKSFSTAKMQSTAGTGIASPSLEDANFLNPSSSAFFKETRVSVLKTGVGIDPLGENDRVGESEADDWGVIVSDGTGPSAGSLSYVSQTLGKQERKQFGFSYSKAMRQDLAFGAGVIHTRINNNGEKSSQNQFTLGATHIITPELLLGITYQDPLRENPEDSKAYIGVQYTIRSMISLMLDIGSDYKRGLSETLEMRGAAQIRFFSDFFLRAGIARDRATRSRGYGAGVGWSGPKLKIEVAMASKRLDNYPEVNQTGQKIDETTLSLGYKF